MQTLSRRPTLVPRTRAFIRDYRWRWNTQSMEQVDACPRGVYPLYYWSVRIIPRNFPEATNPLSRIT
jgi:hypothetical protein